MKTLSAASLSLCCVVVAVSVISLLIPHKRTTKMLSFAIGLFVIVSALNVLSGLSNVEIDDAVIGATEYSGISSGDINDAVIGMTAEDLTVELNELLKNEGINADDISLTLKISDNGRIYAARVIIYISKDYANRREDIRSIVYRNLSKEPEIYVAGQ